MKKVSIVTINFNNKEGLKNTTESVFSQTFKDFEYIIIDGGSSDGSIDIIKQNLDRLTYWVSEPDKGIYNAMNKGIKASEGDYLLFLNSGDRLIDSEILARVLPELETEDVIYGNGILEMNNKDNIKVEIPEKLELDYFVNTSLFHSATFIKRQLFNTYGLYNEANRIVSDWEFFIKTLLVNNVSSKKINLYIAVAEGNGISRNKENKQLLNEEIVTVLNRYFSPAVIALMHNQKRLKQELKVLKNKQEKTIFYRLGTLIRKWKKKI